MSRTTNRRAVTLTEVLIGLMAILSLFPLGAAQMAQALQDQRASEAATMASAFARNMWKQACDADANDAQMKFRAADGSPYSPYGGSYWDKQFIMAMDDPNSGLPTSMKITAMQAMPKNGAAPVASAPNPTGPSYPVLVDPIGWQANQSVNAGLPNWVGYMTAAPQAWYVPRRTLYMKDPTVATPPAQWIPLGAGSIPGMGGTLAPSLIRIVKQFSLMDDMTFGPAGTPVSGASAPVERQGRYSWAFMFRRSNNADRTAVDITTIMYSGRSIDVASQETAYAGTIAFPTATAGVTPMTKTVVLTYSNPKPAIRRGGWILDATMADASGHPEPQGIFYRVVNVDDSTPGSLVLELQTPIVGKSNPSVPQTTQRTIVVMDKVIEVFTKKDVSNVAPPMPY